jgi:hypothetical protein
MVKKLFALASVTALTGLVAAVAASGCSSTTVETESDAATTAEGGPKAEAGKKDAEQEPEAGPPVCPSTTPVTGAEIEAQIKWLPPAAVQSVCTQDNIDALKKLFKDAPAGGGVKLADIKTALGATCSPCVFSPIAGPSWQVFVEDTNGALDNRTSSCFAQLESPACGKARSQWETCLDVACPESDCGADKVQQCAQKAQSGACKDLTDVYAKACPNEGDMIDVCGNIFSAIAVSCSGGDAAAIDASAP